MRRILLLAAVILAAGLSVRPSPARADDPIQFYGPCWADASGKDGKGGVSIVVSGNDHKFLLRADPCKEKIDPKTLGDHPNWVVYDSEDSGKCLSFEFTLVTTPQDKFWGRRWAGGGVAFNNSWSTVDFSGAKYLVFYARTNAPGVDFNLALTGATDADQTGMVKVGDYAEGHRIGEKWTRVVIPLAVIPSLSKLDLARVKTLRFDLAGTYPENTPVYVHLDKIFFTDTQLVTPVENLGWLREPGGVELVWDKADDSGITRYLVKVDGKLVGRVDGADKRRVRIPDSLLPGTGEHVAGVAASNEKQVSAYQSVTLSLAPKAVETAEVAVSPHNGHAISPYLYGVNYQDAETLGKLGATVNRWGGNATSNYNWKQDADNRGADWYYLNTAGAAPGSPEKDKRYYQFIRDSFKGGSQAIITIPTNGWVAKAPPKGGPELCSFPTSKYPGQTGSDGQGAGNGRLPGGKLIWDTDPNYNYVPSTPKFQEEWVKTILKEFGLPAKGGVEFFQMDNEPGLWAENHRDICPKGIGYDDLVKLNAEYALAVKRADPRAKVIGWTAWGVMALAGSNWDYYPGGEAGYKDRGGQGEKWTDRKAHGDLPQVVYYLRQMARLSKKDGVRLIDYLDFHGFPEVWGKDENGRNIKLITDDTPYNPMVCQKQFDALRVFWDPTFTDPDSWCANPGNKPYLWDPFVGILPKLKRIVDENFPGTKLSMTEYYPSSSSYYHGGLLEAATLGIFMREGLDMACDWGGVQPDNYVFYAHRLYSNYDGRGDKVEGDYVSTTCTSKDLYSFAARDRGRTFVVLVNRNPDAQVDTTLDLPEAAASYRTYSLTPTGGKRLYDSGEIKAASRRLQLKVPAFSAVLVVAD